MDELKHSRRCRSGFQFLRRLNNFRDCNAAHATLETSTWAHLKARFMIRTGVANARETGNSIASNKFNFTIERTQKPVATSLFRMAFSEGEGEKGWARKISINFDFRAAPIHRLGFLRVEQKREWGCKWIRVGGNEEHVSIKTPTWRWRCRPLPYSDAQSHSILYRLIKKLDFHCSQCSASPHPPSSSDSSISPLFNHDDAERWEKCFSPDEARRVFINHGFADVGLAFCERNIGWSYPFAFRNVLLFMCLPWSLKFFLDIQHEGPPLSAKHFSTTMRKSLKDSLHHPQRLLCFCHLFPLRSIKWTFWFVCDADFDAGNLLKTLHNEVQLGFVVRGWRLWNFLWCVFITNLMVNLHLSNNPSIIFSISHRFIKLDTHNGFLLCSLQRISISLLPVIWKQQKMNE